MKTRTVWELARMAECSDPDTDKSPGADFLRSIESSVKDVLSYTDQDAERADWHHDQAHEIADLCVPVYTHDLWSTFVDLLAYREDVSELGMESVPTDELEKLPSLALYMIGERLALALFEDELSERGGRVMIELHDTNGNFVAGGFKSHAEAARAWCESYRPEPMWIDDDGDQWDAEDTFDSLGLGRYDS